MLKEREVNYRSLISKDSKWPIVTNSAPSVSLPPPSSSWLVFPASHLSESLSVLVPLGPDPALFPHCPVVERGDPDSQPPLM